MTIYSNDKILCHYVFSLFSLNYKISFQFKYKAIVLYTFKILYQLKLLSLEIWKRCPFSLIFLFEIIIIMMSCRQHGYPWPSLATSPYHSSPPAGLLGYILCPHIAAVCKFRPVVLLLFGHMWGSIGVHHLRARPYLK